MLGYKELPVKVDDLLIHIFYYLKSSNGKQEFKEFQKRAGVPEHNVLKHVCTRWLSLGQCITRLLEQWEALKPFFKEEVKKTCRKRTASEPGIAPCLKNTDTASSTHKAVNSPIANACHTSHSAKGSRTSLSSTRQNVAKQLCSQLVLYSL